jgi:polysaccharide deacetylase family protein (PEP-CTERM system associated)
MTAEPAPGATRLSGPFGWALTVDVEEWYHNCQVPDYVEPARRPALVEELDWLLPETAEMFDRCGRTATFFVLGEVAARLPGRVRELAAAGHEVASHGMHHLRARSRPLGDFREDITRSRKLLEDTVGDAVNGFRAPEWSLREPSSAVTRAVADAGFVYDSSLMPALGAGRRDNPRFACRLRWPDGAKLLEFPPLVFGGRAQLPAGGWTGRLAAPRWIERAAVRHSERGGLPLLVVHPWELAERPLPGDLTGLARFFHEAGRRQFRQRFAELLAAHPWESIRGALRGNATTTAVFRMPDDTTRSGRAR